MWTTIGIWCGGVLLACGASALLLRMQPLNARPGLVNLIAGLTIGPGFRLVKRFRLTGDRQLLAATAAGWLLWSALGSAVIAILAPGYRPGSLYLLYGLLCALPGAAVGFGIGFLAGYRYAKATRMSSFEGKAGCFVMSIALLGGVIGFLAAGIGMTIFFYRQGR